MYRVVYYDEKNTCTSVDFECDWRGADEAQQQATRYARDLIESNLAVCSEVWTQDLDLWFCELKMTKVCLMK